MRPDDTRKAASLKMRRRPTTGRRPPSPNTPSWGRSTNRRLRTGDAFMGLPRGLGVSQLHPLPSPADRPWSVLASLPSSDLDVSGARRAHPGLPQGERVPEAGMIAAGGPSISRGGGARHRLRVHPHCMALQQGSRAAAAESCLVVAAGWEYTMQKFPIRTGQSISFFLWTPPPRGFPGNSPPPARTDGAGFINPDCGPQLQAPQAGAGFAAPARPPSVGRQRSVGGSMRLRSGARTKGIEAIFRAACGRAYSRTWTQRILGRYADD